MLLTKLISLALLGASVVQATEPSFGIAYSDLSLDSRFGRAELRQRVTAAIGGYCRRHGDRVTPQALRNDRYYCPDMMRSALMAEMPREVRHAYMQARREAGVRGRRL